MRRFIALVGVFVVALFMIANGMNRMKGKNGVFEFVPRFTEHNTRGAGNSRQLSDARKLAETLIAHKAILEMTDSMAEQRRAYFEEERRRLGRYGERTQSQY
mmetsp:Transcript_20477/g.29616  ORF Transcript_20477/g.29616 Transcript_20477/m.29616 type:complete len:102 (-) Transcript_20477:121-426(-)